MSHGEQGVVFSCAGEQLLGMITVPAVPASIGVLIIVGGPQYRVGSHRQFLLLSRVLSAAGYPVMRFDFRGMGDSSGDLRHFEMIDDDIAAAISAFREHCPQLESIVLWGLCDAATAALLYWDRTRDACIGGLVLLNPWVRSEATLARTHVKHYYAQRLVQGEFWRKLLSGRLGVVGALRGLAASLLRAGQPVHGDSACGDLPFQQRMMRALETFPGASLLILSGDDYTAKEFLEYASSNADWHGLLDRPGLSRLDMPAADHTFSSQEWRKTVENACLDWLEKHD